MTDETFLIHELAERAGTTVRTIRYYTDEGLLPQPLTQGKYAYYTRDHLNRLELIRRMKEAYLPLREIRQVMLSLTAEEVTRRLAEPAAPAPAPTREGGAGADALNYISRIIDGQAAHRSQPKMAAPPPAPAPAVPPQPMLKRALAEEAPSNAPENLPGSEHWERVTLAPGVELALRSPADADTMNRVHQVIAFARKLFR